MADLKTTRNEMEKKQYPNTTERRQQNLNFNYTESKLIDGASKLNGLLPKWVLLFFLDKENLV